MLAAAQLDLDVLKALVSGHADLNLADRSGRTALAYAEKAGRAENAAFLRRLGAR